MLSLVGNWNIYGTICSCPVKIIILVNIEQRKNQLCGTKQTPLPRPPTSTALSNREKGPRQLKTKKELKLRL